MQILWAFRSNPWRGLEPARAIAEQQLRGHLIVYGNQARMTRRYRAPGIPGAGGSSNANPADEP
jgi:hypothetical protein